MEAIFGSSIADPSKQMKSPSSKRNIRGPLTRSTENLAPTNYHEGGGAGLLFPPPPPPSLSFSCPTSFSLVYPPQQQRQAQPPLLPLPTSTPHPSYPPPTTRKTNRSRDQSLTPKKSKQITISRREQPKATSNKKSLIVSSTIPSGTDPNNLAKHVPKVLSSSSLVAAGNGVNNNNNNNNTHNSNIINMEDLERFSGSVFTLSPHPSSLPLPKFSMRPPKLSCTAEAAGNVDAGATDNLRRLLRLR